MGTLALIVQDGRGDIPVLIPSLAQAVTKVDILAIHEEVLVEESYAVECLTPQHAEGSADDIDAHGLIPRQEAEIVAAKASALGKARAQAGHLVERGHGGGQTAA